MRKLLLLLAIALFFVSCQSTINLSQNEIKALGDKFAMMHTKRLNFLEEGDVPSAVDCYAENAYLFDIGATVQGKQSIQRHLAEVLKSMSLKNTKNTQKEVEVSGNLAYDYGVTTMELHYIYTETVEKVKSKYIAIWKKQTDGEWKIIKLIFNQDG